MRVVTLTPARFADACTRLQMQMEHNGFRPDLVVGIATGGVEVAKLIFKDIAHVQIVCQRPSTRTKGKHAMLMRIVRACPLWLRNWLRIAEARWLARTERRPVTAVLPDASRFPIVVARTILVVDDAVDSGATLRQVLAEVHRLNADAVVRTAALTVTTPEPVCMPDYTLYNNRTLLRFPWSMDMK